jgi:hypothetical protein
MPTKTRDCNRSLLSGIAFRHISRCISSPMAQSHLSQ